MTEKEKKIAEIAASLAAARVSRIPVDPVTTTAPEFDINDAYCHSTS